MGKRPRPLFSKIIVCLQHQRSLSPALNVGSSPKLIILFPKAINTFVLA